MFLVTCEAGRYSDWVGWVYATAETLEAAEQAAAEARAAADACRQHAAEDDTVCYDRVAEKVAVMRLAERRVESVSVQMYSDEQHRITGGWRSVDAGQLRWPSNGLFGEVVYLRG